MTILLAIFLVLLALSVSGKEEELRERRYAAEELEGDGGKLNTTLLEYGLQWEAWKVTHRRSYLTLVEELERFVIWRANQAFIDYHNNYASKLGFTLRMNQFGDLTSEEFAHATKCVDYARIKSNTLNITTFNASTIRSGTTLPREVDWRTMGAVSSVKDSGRCRSCYAFATTGVLEGLHALTTGKLVSLSEQNIIDCTIPYGNRGCSGGSVETSLMYIIDSGGLDTAQYYPYKERFYSGGVFTEPSCSRTKLTQSLLIIGYGRTRRGRDYWILKNSWGTTWGMNGFMLMARNLNNHCGIASRAVYPSS